MIYFESDELVIIKVEWNCLKKVYIENGKKI